VAVVGQAEAVVAGTAVVARDVDTLVDTACVVFPLALVDVCGERRAGELRGCAG